jgi:hypothetical protein
MDCVPRTDGRIASTSSPESFDLMDEGIGRMD